MEATPKWGGEEMSSFRWVTSRFRCARPMLNELPPPPPGKTGWPWAEESLQLSGTMPDGSPWPRVSIVTPSYNQGQFIEETIRSVLLQGYPDLEYIIIDGGSTDGSVDIIRKYEDWLACWVSEPDKGQSDAINKGFARARGDIFAWLNSDDTYEPGAISMAAQYLIEHPNVGMIYSDCNFIDETSRVIGRHRTGHFDLNELLRGYNHIPQQATFFRREVWQKAGPLDITLHYAMDYDLWIRIGLNSCVRYIPGVPANFRVWHDAKTVSNRHKAWAEQLKVYRTYGGGYLSSIYFRYCVRNLLSLVPPLERAIQWRRWPWLRQIM